MFFLIILHDIFVDFMGTIFYKSTFQNHLKPRQTLKYEEHDNTDIVVYCRILSDAYSNIFRTLHTISIDFSSVVFLLISILGSLVLSVSQWKT